jgi:hypothetical protein
LAGDPRTYVYTDLTAADAVVLRVGDATYDVAQVTASWAVNELPRAVCLLAMGRSTATLDPANIHRTGRPKAMTPAQITFHPRGRYDRSRDWPDGPKVVFDGFFAGFAYRKVGGKVQVVANLLHWAAALGFSSAVSSAVHAANPTALNAAAVLPSLAAAGARQVHYVSELAAAETAAPVIATDAWGALKAVFCGLANTPTQALTFHPDCDADGRSYAVNSAALAALARVEGPGLGNVADRPYKYGVPLQLPAAVTGVPSILRAVTRYVGETMVEAYANTTFWDKLVGDFCPQFGLAFLPAVDYALVAADTPAYNQGAWRTLEVFDYDSLDQSADLDRPLRAVGVTVGYASTTGAIIDAGQAGPVRPEFGRVGGCFAADSVAPGDGALLVVKAPEWLGQVTCPPGAGESLGLTTGRAARTATTPQGAATGDPTLSADPQSLSAVCGIYAHAVYVGYALRGRSGVASGKLRFDVAPGSIVRIRPSPERFVGKLTNKLTAAAGFDGLTGALGPGEKGTPDALAVPLVGCVQRVTVTINAEAGMAGTTFLLTHLRSEDENHEDRTSVTEHPLFGKSIHGGGRHGSPLVTDYAFEG